MFPYSNIHMCALLDKSTQSEVISNTRWTWSCTESRTKKWL